MKKFALMIEFSQQKRYSSKYFEKHCSNLSTGVSLAGVLCVNFVQFSGKSSKELLVHVSWKQILPVLGAGPSNSVNSAIRYFWAT